MIITRQQLFNVAWRIAILALPWQTRWIFSIETIGGSTWEQGTVAVYASWIAMILAVGVGARLCLAPNNVAQSNGARQSLAPTRIACLIAALALIGGSFFTASSTATLLWWSHIVLLAAFVWVLWKNNVTRMELATWFVIALMPHVLLGIWQFLEQKIDGSALLGIADQRAWMRGVSVVEYGEYRVLRAYGGFPHPNVFGGWVAMGLTLLVGLVHQSRTARIKFAWIACAALCAMALILSFSRGAWIAAAVGVNSAVVITWFRSTAKQREALLSAGGVVAAVLALMVFSQWDAVLTRFQGSARLEQWSVEQRVTSFRDGIDAFLQRPFNGWGPGAALVGIANLERERPPAAVSLTADGAWTMFRAPLEPPHAAPLAALLEIGIIGMLGIAACAFFFLRSLIRTKQLVSALPFIGAGVILAATDHYFWTLWAGQALAAMILLILLSPLQKTNDLPRE